MNDLEYKVKEAVAERAGIPFASVEDNATLAGELNLDSLDMVQLAIDLEAEIDVQFADSDIQANMTVAQLVERVNRKAAAV